MLLEMSVLPSQQGATRYCRFQSNLSHEGLDELRLGRQYMRSRHHCQNLKDLSPHVRVHHIAPTLQQVLNHVTQKVLNLQRTVRNDQRQTDR